MKPEMKAPNVTEGNLKGKHGRMTGPARRSSKGQWTPEEDEVLCKAVERFQGKNWKKIAECVKDRTDVQCLHRWQKVLNPELVKGPWSKEEDDTIIALVEKYGPTKWSTISQHLPGRIGKQCRERWHNHLNPGINKNAWTQEEELTLIRAHQIYGNKWAELMKFLPGRSDNAIKNQWNSSVKKKLDSYYASGLLDQCQNSPLVSLQNRSIASSSSLMHSSGDESNFRQGADAEESECSQASTVFSCSQSANDLLDEVKPPNEEFYVPELTSGVEQQILNSPSHAESHCPSFEDVKIVVPEVRTTKATEAHLQSVSSNIKQDLDLDCPQLLTNNMDGDGTNEACQAFQDSARLSDQPSLQNLDTGILHSQPQTLTKDVDCCRVLFPHTIKDSGTSSGEQGLNNHAHETGNIPALSWHHSNSKGLEGNNRVALLDSAVKDSVLLHSDSIEGCDLLGATALESETDTNDGHVTSSHGNDDNNGILEQQELSSIPNDSLTLVPLDNFSSPSRVNKIYFPIDEKPAERDNKGSLFYEPPRFPSADIPLFSCDLVQSNGDLRQEYSPFGIRQLMNCTSTPLRLWDSSPGRHDKSPDVMLKDAARSFSGAPSILKKRHRELLLSPLLDRRKEKMVKSAKASSLALDFSRLDGGEDCNSSRLSECPDNKNKCVPSSEAKEDSNEALESGGVSSAKIDQETRRSLVYCNDPEMQLSSPDKTRPRPDTNGKDPSNQLENSEPPFTADDIPFSEIAEIKTNTAESSIDIIENFSIFDGTPFKKLLDTPSPWKSPLLFGSSFLQSPSLGPEITIEDMGCFMSPGERSYDAIGLMKHLSEHTATTYADALEVLGNDTPETILKKRQLNKSIQGKENQQWPQDKLENRPQVEGRALDFSNCGTPGKAKVSSASPGGYSSPSSYLLKNCR